MWTILGFFLATIWTDSTKSHEQLTVDYFFKTIWAEQYLDYKLIECDLKTDTTVYLNAIYSCEKWDDKEIKDVEELKKIIRARTTEELRLIKPETKVRIKKTSNSKRLKLNIGRAIQIGDNYVVPFKVYKPLHFVDHYFIKFDRGGHIIDKCVVGEII